MTGPAPPACQEDPPAARACPQPARAPAADSATHEGL